MTETQEVAAMRKAFEADVIKELANIFDYSRMFERDLTGKYLSYTLQKRWDSWQAATAQATAGMKDRLLAALERAAAAETSLREEVEQERERCAKLCDLLGGDIDPRDPDEVALAANSLADAIRKIEAPGAPE